MRFFSWLARQFGEPERMYFPDKPWLYIDPRTGTLCCDIHKIHLSPEHQRQLAALREMQEKTSRIPNEFCKPAALSQPATQQGE